MVKFTLSERYRLELHWSNASYTQDGICALGGTYFSGAALMDAQKLNNNDYIMLDFFHQYIVVTNNVYVAKLSWDGVVYNEDNTITLRNAMITHETELNRVPKLLDTDYLIIDTEGHDASEHMFNLLYKVYVVNVDTQLYKFGGK